jgi:lysophospholipase L1-like esterase
MSRRFHLLSFRSLLLAVVAACVTSHAFAQTPVRIMPLGDSITAGPGCWRAYLWNQLQTAGYSNIDFVGGVNDGGGCNPGFTYDFDHEGHSGFSITGIADGNQLPPWLTAARPDIIVMHLGTNDMWGGFIPLETKITALTKLVGQMRANNPNVKLIASKIIPMSPSSCPTCAADVVAFDNAIPGWAAGLTTAQSPIYVVDQWTGFDVVADTNDGVHPVTSGFIKMANRFFPVVAQALGAATPGVALTVSKAGTGAGTVTSSPAGINCGATCSANFTSGASVTLTAAATSGSTFAGWSGACTGTSTCTVSMTQARAVTATFNGSGGTFALTVTRAGAGTGAITSNPAGISCGTTCGANYASGTVVTLTATVASNSTFGGWSGACTGTGSCSVSMTQARAVTATFNAMATFSLSVTKAGTGSGTVTSSPAGINCGTACVADFGGNASVTLTAAAASGSTFAGWSGACTGTGNCVLTLNQARAVTATFNTSGSTGGTCANPVTFTGNSGNFNTTGAVCYRTNTNVAGWGCYNFDGRTLTVGGVARTCGQMPLTRAADGYYYFAATAGQFPWAGLFTW